MKTETADSVDYRQFPDMDMEMKDILNAVREEVNRKEPDIFWREMREYVNTRIVSDSYTEHKPSLLSLFTRWWWALTPLPLAVAAAALFFMIQPDRQLTYDDLWIVSCGGLPVSAMIETEQDNEDIVDEDIFRGISDSWTALLADTV